MTGIGGHHSAKMKTDKWLTPRHILEALGPFDLDPCSAPDVSVWPTASVHYTLPTDGLAMPWFGRVWLNPPYGRAAEKWLAKLAQHGTGTALVFARTETEMWFEHVWPKATAILFLEGRLFFHYPDGTRAEHNSGGPSALIAYGNRDAEALRSGALKGAYVKLVPAFVGTVQGKTLEAV